MDAIAWARTRLAQAVTAGRRDAGSAPRRHRAYHWTMSEHSLAPTLLLSMPQLHDPNFAQTVVLLCQHSEEGAFGLVMNRPITTTAKVMAHGTIDDASEHELEVWIGGPVEPDRSWILLPDDDSDERGDPGVRGRVPSTSASVLQRIIDHDARRPHPPDRRIRGLGPRPARRGARRLGVAQRGCAARI